MVEFIRRAILTGGALAAAVVLSAGCAADGRAVYVAEKCPSCHSFKGEGGNLAPDLTAVTGRQPEEWIRRQITAPSQNDPRTRMPAYGHLSRREVSAIVTYLEK